MIAPQTSRRIEKVNASGSTVYLYAVANVVEERDASGAVVASYAQGLGIDEPMAMQRGGNVEYYQADGLGSITSLTGGTGQLTATYGYDSFGNTTPTEGIFNPYRYTAREQDSETGLYYYRARYYSPDLGRFISEDPIGFSGDGPNFYAYVENDPINHSDPFGLCQIVNDHTVSSRSPGFRKSNQSFAACMAGELTNNFFGDDDRAGVTVAVHVALIVAMRGAGALLPGPGWLYVGTAVAWDAANVAQAYATCREELRRQ